MRFETKIAVVVRADLAARRSTRRGTASTGW